MIICTKCKSTANNGACPICKSKKLLKEASDDDLVLVTSTDYVSSFLVEDILKDAGIKFLKKGALGGAITLYVGEMTESFNFFVMARDYDEAAALIPKLELDEAEFDIVEDE